MKTSTEAARELYAEKLARHLDPMLLSLKAGPELRELILATLALAYNSGKQAGNEEVRKIAERVIR